MMQFSMLTVPESTTYLLRNLPVSMFKATKAEHHDNSEKPLSGWNLDKLFDYRHSFLQRITDSLRGFHNIHEAIAAHHFKIWET